MIVKIGKKSLYSQKKNNHHVSKVLPNYTSDVNFMILESLFSTKYIYKIILNKTVFLRNFSEVFFTCLSKYLKITS